MHLGGERGGGLSRYLLIVSAIRTARTYVRNKVVYLTWLGENRRVARVRMVMIQFASPTCKGVYQERDAG